MLPKPRDPLDGIANRLTREQLVDHRLRAGGSHGDRHILLMLRALDEADDTRPAATAKKVWANISAC